MPEQQQKTDEREDRYIVEDHPKGGSAVIDTMATDATGAPVDEVVTRWFGSNPAAGTSDEDQAERLAAELNARVDPDTGKLRPANERAARPGRRRRQR